MQRSVLSGCSDKAMCAPVIALDRFGIGYFARIKQFESVEIDVVEFLSSPLYVTKTSRRSMIVAVGLSRIF